ncbi:MAG TPA: hypothetical protein VNZ22_13275, partial [Bacillota bacterium]|nr:hypothetical protein [Bacillota bacterium]
MKKIFLSHSARTAGVSTQPGRGAAVRSLLGAASLTAFALSASAQFVAYNDSAYRADQYTFTPYITTYTIDNTYSLPTSGFLKDAANSGALLGVTATFSQFGSPKVELDTTYGGDNCAAGTDADTIFGGKVDLHGAQVYGT